MNFDLDLPQRRKVLDFVLEKVENYYQHTKALPVTPELDLKKIREYIEEANFDSTGNFEVAVDHVIGGLEKYIVHTPHPKYFGLYNPRSNFAGILADLITATFNPQMAAWSHAPFANEVETRLIKDFGERFGYNRESTDGVFTSGGAEANLTALLCALNHKYPQFSKEGVLGLGERPVILCSQEVHHSIQKAAGIVGLGYRSVISVPVNENMQIDTHLLEEILTDLRGSGKTACIIIGTAGTTGVGAIDDLKKLGNIARQHDAWFHVDAAYGGAAVLSKNLNHLIAGIELADSITFDAHKWMSVPMSASMFITSHPDSLYQTFRSTTEYMPKEAQKMEVIDPYSHSIQWSRRFIGLKVYLSLLFFGWEGYEKTIDHQTDIGDYFRNQLIENGWIIKNNSALPVICFTDEAFEEDPLFTQSILDKILAGGTSWLSVYPIHGISTLRVCITNYKTNESDINELIQELNQARIS